MSRSAHRALIDGDSDPTLTRPSATCQTVALLEEAAPPLLLSNGGSGLRPVAEVDGNRTRHARIARITRFEGGGAHQVLIHLPVDPEIDRAEYGRDRVVQRVGDPFS